MKLPSAQLLKEYCTAVLAINKHSAATSSVEWDIHGRRVKSAFEHVKKVFAITPDSK
jgi:hypothetical protein